jgi:acyl dehydratase
MLTLNGIDEIKSYVGKEIGVSDWHEVTQDDINTFADVTGDHQWIHVDIEKSRKMSPFGGPVAHGFLTLSLLAAAVGSAGIVPADAKGALNYGLDNIRFIAPVPAGKRVTANFKLISVEDKGPKGQLLRIAATLEIDGSDKPAVVGELLALVIG